MGRKKTELNYDVIDTALFYSATIKQLQFLLSKKGKEVKALTLQRVIQQDKKMTFSEYRETQLEGLRFKLIQKAISKALDGDNTMLIFCLKNICGWSDKQESKVDANVTLESLIDSTFEGENGENQ